MKAGPQKQRKHGGANNNRGEKDYTGFKAFTLIKNNLRRGGGRRETKKRGVWGGNEPGKKGGGEKDLVSTLYSTQGGKIPQQTKGKQVGFIVLGSKGRKKT